MACKASVKVEVYFHILVV